MSRLARSPVNSVGIDPGADVRPTVAAERCTVDADDGEVGGELSPGRRVEEDISEPTETLTRQLSGVTSSLSPSSQPVDRSSEIPPLSADSPPPGSDRSLTKDASDLPCDYLPIEEEEESEGGVIGLTEEVLAFARNISMHPETWLDCPLLPDDDEPEDFEMSASQQEHSLAIEYLVPRLAALRIELCPVHMSEGCFWKIYFVLLHPRLHKEDAEYLSTPQIVEARAAMLQEQQNRMKLEMDRILKEGMDGFSRTTSFKESVSTPSSEQQQSSSDTPDALDKTQTMEESIPSTFPTELEMETHSDMMTEINILDKDAPEEWQQPEPSKTSNTLVNYEVDEDDTWLEDDDVIEMNGMGATFVQIDNEDISFSDLEDSD